MVQPRFKIVCWFLTKLNILLTYHSAIPSSIYPNKSKTYIPTQTYTRMFTAPLFTIAKTWKQSRCPSVDEWIIKLWYIHTVEYFF